MTIVSNPLLLSGTGETAEADGDARSVRFASEDAPRLSKTPGSSGGRKTWTFSCWFKFGKIPQDVQYGQVLFAAGQSDQDQIRIGFEGYDYDDARLQVQGTNSNSVVFKLETNSVFRDPGAWYHICVAYDAAQGTAANRVKIYINGLRLTSFATATYPGQNVGTYAGHTVPHHIGTMQLNTTPTYVWEFDGYLADVIFADGRTLLPSAFGKFDATRNWVKQDFGIAVNNGENWTSRVIPTGDISSNNGFENLFDGDSSTTPYCSGGNKTMKAYFDPPIQFADRIRLYGKNHNSASNTYKAYVNDTMVELPTTTGWLDISAQCTEGFKSLKLGDENGKYTIVFDIEVDGVVLKDNQSDTRAALTFPNNGTTWSSGGSGGTNAGSGFDKMFDGSASTAMSSSGNASSEVTVTFDPALTVQSVEVNPGSLASQFKINSGSYTTITDDGGYHSLGFSGTLTTLTIKGDSGTNAAPRCEGIRVDGHTLIDGANNNSFHLNFVNAGTLGKDAFAKLGDFDATNLVGSDSSNPETVDLLYDYPSNIVPGGGDTGAGGTVRSNYCTLNTLDSQNNTTLKQAALRMDSSADASCRGTIANHNKKWYYEATVNSGPGATTIGVHSTAVTVHEFTDDAMEYRVDNGEIYGGSGSHPGTTFSSGDTLGVAVNKADATGTISFYKNGSLIQTRDLNSDTNDNPVVPIVRTPSSGVIDFNFGQRAFKNSAPNGYSSWCAANLPDLFGSASDTNHPRKYFDAKAYTGQTWKMISPLWDFAADMVWAKKRDGADGHKVYDRMRGTQEELSPTYGDTESNVANTLTAWYSDGFRMGSENDINGDGETYVIYGWDGGSNTTNSDGSITPSDQYINSTAGFSFCTWSGTAAAATVGHGLGAKPDMYVVKKMTTGTGSWITYHKAYGATKGTRMDLPNSWITTTGYFNDTEPTNSVFSVSVNGETNGSSGAEYYAWVFTSIPQYSKMGSYTGGGGSGWPNGNGRFVHLGFRPKFLLIKCPSESENWVIMDTARSPFNYNNKKLVPNSDAQEVDPANNHEIDFLSNGFKLRNNTGELNGDGKMYIFMAFADHPMKTARAR